MIFQSSNFFTKNEEVEIFNELKGLHPENEANFFFTDKYLDHYCQRPDGETQWSTNGITLADVYKEPRFSAIARHTRKLFSQGFTAHFAEMAPENRMILTTNRNSTIVSYFGPGATMHPHAGKGLITCQMWLWACDDCCPPIVTLYGEENEEITIENNSLLIFPSFEVSSVQREEDSEEIPHGEAPYCITTYLYTADDSGIGE